MTAPRRHSLPIPGLAWRGFTLQVFLFLFLPLAVLLVAIAFGSQRLHHNAMREMVGDRDLRAVRAAANSLGQEAAHRARLLRLLAEQPGELQLPNVDLPGDPFPGGMAVLSADGERILSMPGSVLADLTGTQLRALVSTTGEFSTPFHLPGQAQPWALALARRPDGYILVGAFSPGNLARQAMTGAVDPAQTTIRLAGPGGMVLYQNGPQSSSGEMMGMESALAGESGIDYHHSPDGEHVIAFSPVPGTGWGLVLEESWESIASPALNTTQWAPLVLAPLLVLALLALWFGARQVIHPLQSLQAGTAELARGNFRAVDHPVGGISEIRLLQADLVAMARGLESAQNSLRAYIGAITAGVENERRSLARELHDDTLQTLIALQQRIQLAGRANNADPSLEAVRQQVQQTITNLRRMVRGLRPIYLEDLGLPAALEMLARESGQNGELEIDFEILGEEFRLPPESELALYRITQEALSNVVRHARATHARVTIEYRSNSVLQSVSDNGRGFRPEDDQSEYARRGHFGLVGMAERAELAGARLTIQSAPGRGTYVEVAIPRAASEANR